MSMKSPRRDCIELSVDDADEEVRTGHLLTPPTKALNCSLGVLAFLADNTGTMSVPNHDPGRSRRDEKCECVHGCQELGVRGPIQRGNSRVSARVTTVR
jgi:hypothetical protein